MAKDSIWKGDDRALEVTATFVWVDFGAQYTGPSFFPRSIQEELGLPSLA
jgi:hypothetical protein